MGVDWMLRKVILFSAWADPVVPLSGADAKIAGKGKNCFKNRPGPRGVLP